MDGHQAPKLIKSRQGRVQEYKELSVQPRTLLRLHGRERSWLRVCRLHCSFKHEAFEGPGYCSKLFALHILLKGEMDA